VKSLPKSANEVVGRHAQRRATHERGHVDLDVAIREESPQPGPVLLVRPQEHLIDDLLHIAFVDDRRSTSRAHHGPLLLAHSSQTRLKTRAIN
jgi:hypothetical protein